MTDEPDKREHPVLAADEDPAPLPLARAFEQPGDILPVLELVEQAADALEVGGALFVDQVGLAAHDQHRALRLVDAPVGKPRRDQLGGGDVERGAALADLGPQPRLGLAQRQPRQPRADIIADLGSAIALVPAGSATTRFSTLPSAPTSTASARSGASGTKLNWRRRSSLLGASTTPGAGRQPRQRRHRRAERFLDRAVLRARPRSPRARAGAAARCA